MDTRIETRRDTYATDSDSRSLAELAKELRDESIALVREEVTLAKTEISEKAARVARNGAYLGVGAVVVNAALVVLLIAASAGIYAGLIAGGFSHMLAGWLSPLIVGVITALIGYALIQKGVSTLSNETIVPERTAQSLRDDKQWIERKVT